LHEVTDDSTTEHDHQHAFDAYYLWDPIVKHVWLEGRLPDILAKQGELNLDGSRGWFDSVFTQHIYEELRPEPGQRVLNIGCGFGRDELEMQRRCADLELAACDISETMLRTARRNDCPARLYQCPAEELPFADATFDRVLSREVIEHVMDPPAVLREAFRVLAPGGRAVVTTPNGSSLIQTAVRLTGLFANTSVQDEAIPLPRLVRWCREAGFRVEKVVLDGAGYFMMVTFPDWLRGIVPRAGRVMRVCERLPLIARLVCDQTKVTLVKPDAAAPDEAGDGPEWPPESCPEGPEDERLRQAVEAARAPAAKSALMWVRGAISAFLLPLVYLILVAVLLPISLVLLAGKLLGKLGTNG